MWMYASYYALSDEEYNNFMDYNSDEKYEFLEEKDEDNEALTTDLDKAWDGLFYILAGKDADPEQNIFWIAIFWEKTIQQEDYIGITSSQKISEILENLEKINIVEKIAQISFEEMMKNDVYPAIWDEQNRENLTKYLMDYFEELKNFYKKVQEQNLNVLVTLW